MNILHSTKILKTSPANSCLPNLYPSSSARGPKVRTTKVELQHPRWWHLRWRKPTNGVDGHESESIQAVNYCLSPTLTSGYLKVLGEIMAEIERERHVRGEPTQKSKKTAITSCNLYLDFWGPWKFNPHRFSLVKSPGNLVEANVPAIQDEPLEERGRIR